MGQQQSQYEPRYYYPDAYAPPDSRMHNSRTSLVQYNRAAPSSNPQGDEPYSHNPEGFAALRKSMDIVPAGLTPGDYFVPGVGYVAPNHPYWHNEDKELAASYDPDGVFRFWRVVVVMFVGGYVLKGATTARRS